MSDLVLVIQHVVTEKKSYALNSYNIPPDATAEDIAEVIAMFKREREGKYPDVVDESFPVIIQTKKERAGSGAGEWPLL